MHKPESAKPVIAIAWPKPDYLKALERAGAEPRVLRHDEDPLPAALDECDGILMTGGVDVDPARYGDAERHATVSIDAERDEYESALIRLALERDLPMLAICRGVQLLNVVSGGTLIQDIPTSVTTKLLHRRERPKRRNRTRAHDIHIAADTCLSVLLDGMKDAKGRVPVNSRHHQAIKHVAPGFVVSATAPDGVVEAIEKPAANFCVGVQWHPENYWETGEFTALFDGLTRAALTRRLQRAG